jgi:hypothetical protein
MGRCSRPRAGQRATPAGPEPTTTVPGSSVTKLQPGDLVLVRHHTRRGLEPKWVGPVGIIADAHGNCYWAERGAYAIREDPTTFDSLPDKQRPTMTRRKSPTKPGTKREPRNPPLWDDSYRTNLLLSSRSCTNIDADSSCVDEVGNPSSQCPEVIVFSWNRF